MTNEEVLKKLKIDKDIYMIDLTDEQKNDKELILELIKIDPCAYRFASKELKQDEQVCLFAVKNDLLIVDDIPKEKFKSVEFTNKIIEAARENAHASFNNKSKLKDKLSLTEHVHEFAEHLSDIIKSVEKEKMHIYYQNKYDEFRNSEEKYCIAKKNKESREIFDNMEKTFDDMKRER